MIAKNATSSHLRRWGLAMALYDCAYVLYVAGRSGTLAPLYGRVRGLRDWRAYRARGSVGRLPVMLAPSAGVAAALHRNRVYRSTTVVTRTTLRP
jgi:hypothetical protein